MEILPVIYLVYMFISIYFLTLFLMLYFHNKKTLFNCPTTKKKYSISILVPAYNEEKTIQDTINSIFEVDYPIKEVIVLNDGSKDRTKEFAEELKKRYPNLIVVNKENSGKADSLNVGIKMAKGELVVVVDADSYPAKDSFRKMVGFFDDEKVGAATCLIVPRNREKFLEKMQVIEYNIIAFSRKLLGYVGAIYVTPGPLAMYRKTALEEVGGFDTKNMTEDIEATWRLMDAKYNREMCLSAKVTTTAPNKFRQWYTQRRRWAIGGIECIAKYKNKFFKKGMLGMFVVPFFLLQLFIGIVGLGIFLYLVITSLISKFLLVRYSIPANVPLLTMDNLYITPSFLNYLGITLFLAGLIFTLLTLSIMKETVAKKQNIFNVLFFSVFYLAIYPMIALNSIYDYLRGRRKWR